MFPRKAFALLVTGLAISACSAQGDGADEIDEEEISAADARAVLDLSALDLWGQSLPERDVKLTISRDGRAVRAPAGSSVRVFLKDAGRYRVRVEASDHEPAVLELAYDGSREPHGLAVVERPARAGAALAHDTVTVEGRPLPAHALFAGLRHTWFSAQGRPARRGNAVTFFMDGQEAWKDVHGALGTAKDSIQIASWWWDSSFELVRDLDLAKSPEQRWPNTILGALEASPAHKRVIVGQFWGQDGILSWVNTDSKIRAYADRDGDRFEIMGQANETRSSFKFAVPPFSFADRVRATAAGAGRAFDAEPPIESTVPSYDVDLSAGVPLVQDFVDGLLETASYHQKLVSVDGRVALVGGMNFNASDWDTSNHWVFDPRRMPFDATFAQRLDVSGSTKATATPPRKDYMVRVEGPAVQDVDDVFRRRWDFLRDTGAKFSDKSSRFAPVRNMATAGTTQVQVTATMPAPFHEYAIAETWLNAVRAAKRFIYIEDQYFRAPLLNEAIATRLREVPELRVVVVTQPVTKSDPACAPTRRAYGRFKQEFGDRVRFYQLRSFDPSGPGDLAFVDMSTHSKMLLVDDVFMSVGSANKNNRGMVYEGELNVAVLDAAFVTAARRRVMANLLGLRASELPDDWQGALAAAATDNSRVYDGWQSNHASAGTMKRPTGFSYALEYPRLDDCLLASIGPDRM